MHASHHSYIIIVEQINLFHVKFFRHLAIIISKEEFSYIVRFECPSTVLIVVLFIWDLCHEHILIIFGDFELFRSLISLGLAVSGLDHDSAFLKRGDVTCQVLELTHSETKI